MSNENTRRRPRVRKSAPTVRQRAAEAQSKAEKVKPARTKRALRKSGGLFKRLKLPRNRLTKPFYAVGRFVKKVLRWLVPSYFINSWRELKLVTWTSRRDTWRLTGAVFVFAAIFGALVALVDKGLDIIFKNLVLK